MSLILNKGESNEFTFPERRFSMDALPWTKRISELERAYQHGSVITSDRRVNSRPLRIWGTLSYSVRAAFREALEELRAACYVDDPTLHASEYWPDKYIILDSISSFDTVFHITLRSADIDILFKITDPFWYSDTLLTHKETIISSPHIFTLNFDGGIEVLPLITYIAGGAQTEVRILNEGDGSREWIYTGALALNDILEIDTQEGTVKVNGTSHIENFSEAWWNLQPGSNQIRVRITGVIGSSSLQIDYRERWL